MDNKYSVLMSLYSKEKPGYLKLAIQSMIDQTVKPDEIVIVKDGPITKELQDVLDDFIIEYPNLFNIIESKKNIGLGLALNLGLQHCKNDLVARMDTDDISKPERCEKQIQTFTRNNELAIVGSYIDEFECSTKNVVSTRKVPLEEDNIYNFAKRRSSFNHPAVMYRKSKVFENNGYADLKRNQDVDLFGRMLFNGCKAKNLDESLLFFRINNDLAKRRKSWENTRTYISTIRNFWKIGYASFIDYLFVVLAQLLLYLIPIKLQHVIYRKFLRR